MSHEGPEIDNTKISNANYNLSDPHVRFTIDLCVIHNSFRRAMAAIVKAAPTVEPHDVKDFLRYVTVFVLNVHGHHHHEDDIIFPGLSKWVSMDEFTQEHGPIATSIDRIDKLLEAYNKDNYAYDGDALATAVQTLADQLNPHLSLEEFKAAPSKIRDVPVAVLHDIDTKLNAAIKEGTAKVGGPTIALPFLYGHLTAEEKEIFPPDLPWFVKKTAYPAFWWLNKNMWKWCPY